MATIKEGYKILIVDEEGVVIDGLDIGGYNLDNNATGASLGIDIMDSLTRLRPDSLSS